MVNWKKEFTKFLLSKIYNEIDVDLNNIEEINISLDDYESSSIEDLALMYTYLI